MDRLDHSAAALSQLRGWANCTALTSYLVRRPYWVRTPLGLYNRFLREPGVCRGDVSVLLTLEAAELAKRITSDPRPRAMCAGGARSSQVSQALLPDCGRDL